MVQNLNGSISAIQSLGLNPPDWIPTLFIQSMISTSPQKERKREIHADIIKHYLQFPFFMFPLILDCSRIIQL